MTHETSTGGHTARSVKGIDRLNNVYQTDTVQAHAEVRKGVRDGQYQPINHDDPETLKRLYNQEFLSLREIAARSAVSPSTIKRRMEEFGIERREEGRVPWVRFVTSERGYENWRQSGGPNQPQEYIKVGVHRLLAVSEYGTEAVANNHVHHKNGIPWDNRPENIGILSPTEHTKLHNREKTRGPGGEFQ